MACGCCSTTKKDPELFVSRKNRSCTDVIFLLLFIICWGLGIALGAVSISKEPSLFDDLFYPRDSYGNNCGKPGTRVANLPKVFYPRLDEDILDQIDVIASYRYLQF